MSASTPLLAPDSPLDPRARALVQELYDREQAKALALPTDDPLDPKRMQRVEFTRPEILEQPDCIRKTLTAEEAPIAAAARDIAAADIDRIVLTGCGDSLSVMVGIRSLLEAMTGVPCEPVQALDFAYYTGGTVGPRTLVVTLSSSGVTVRTVEALLVAKAHGARSLALTNTPGSALITESDHAILIHAERKGWPTQASTAAFALLAQLALQIGRRRGRAGVDALQSALDSAPDIMAAVIAEQELAVAALAEREKDKPMFLFAGGGPSLATAMFGAAKVKECTPDHALAIPLEEFHHYNSQKTVDPMFVITPRGPSVPRARDTAAEGKRWGGVVYAVVTEDEAALDGLAEAVIRLPSLPEALSPLVTSIPVQLFAYHLAMAQFRAAAVSAAAAR